MRPLIHRFKFIPITMLTLVLALWFIACESTTAIPTPRPTPEDVEVAAVPPPTPTTPATPTPPPAIIAPDDGCVACHSSEEMLKETADEEEEAVESLSEGEG